MIVPGTQFGPWRITEVLAPNVYAGTDSDRGVDVVVKVGAPPAIEAEATALSALAALGHRHLARLAGTADGAIATVRVPGSPLSDLLAGHRRLPWPLAARVLAPVADALAAIHGAGWVHGDVSVANVVLDEDRRGVLVDFGRSHLTGAVAGAAGTPGNVAPEVESGRCGGPAADVWSLAAVVVEAVTGAPLTPTTALPAPVALALRRALAEDPPSRPPAAELASALYAAAGDAVDAACLAANTATPVDGTGARVTRDYGPRPPAPAPPAAARVRRRAPIAAAAAATGVGVGLLLLHDPARPPAAAEPTRPCRDRAAGQLVGDPDGDGCPTTAIWAGGVLTIVVEPGAEPRRYALGAPGDVVALGDWDCDGDDTPGLYRPSTGVVTLYDAWPDAGPGAAPSLVDVGDGLPDPGC